MNPHANKIGPSLNIGGITPLTTIDYPDHLATVIFCQGCPWRCRYCHNTELIRANKQTQYEWPAVVKKIKRRSGFIDAVVFSGGEPTLQKGLPEAIEQIKELGFKTGLHTAGCYPEKLATLLPMLDWVGLDIKALEADYKALTGVATSGSNAWKSLQLMIQSGVEHEVRITVHERLIPENKLQRLIDQLAAIGVKNLALQQCHVEHMLAPEVGHPGFQLTDASIINKSFHLFDKITVRGH